MGGYPPHGQAGMVKRHGCPRVNILFLLSNVVYIVPDVDLFIR